MDCTSGSGDEHEESDTVWVRPHGYEDGQLSALASTLAALHPAGAHTLMRYVRRGNTGEEWIAVRTYDARFLRFAAARQGYVIEVHPGEPEVQV